MGGRERLRRTRIVGEVNSHRRGVAGIHTNIESTGVRTPRGYQKTKSKIMEEWCGQACI
jgi:hypothetical protein